MCSQAARVAAFYERSTFTVAAAKARDPTGGLFSDIDELHRGMPIPGFTNLYVRQRPP
jgi:hypothetical protein